MRRCDQYDYKMQDYVALLFVMESVAKYREGECLPENPYRIDLLCERLLSRDGFDEVAVAWMRISEYEREVHGGVWPLAN